MASFLTILEGPFIPHDVSSSWVLICRIISSSRLILLWVRAVIVALLSRRRTPWWSSAASTSSFFCGGWWWRRRRNVEDISLVRRSHSIFSNAKIYCSILLLDYFIRTRRYKHHHYIPYTVCTIHQKDEKNNIKRRREIEHCVDSCCCFLSTIGPGL